MVEMSQVVCSGSPSQHIPFLACCFSVRYSSTMLIHFIGGFPLTSSSLFCPHTLPSQNHLCSFTSHVHIISVYHTVPIHPLHNPFPLLFHTCQTSYVLIPLCVPPCKHSIYNLFSLCLFHIHF